MTAQDIRPPSRRLLNLAPEVIENVVKQVGVRRDLATTRMVCKALYTPATKDLFESVFLSPSEEVIGIWNNVRQDSSLCHIPRRAIIHTHPDVEGDDHGEGIDIGEDFKLALGALGQFPNLDAIEVVFTPECLGDREGHWWEDVAEVVSRRKEMLVSIFEAIRERAVNDNNRTVRSLTIINLQNCPIPDFTSSDLFRAVMGNLEELHLSIVQECNEHGPDHDCELSMSSACL